MNPGADVKHFFSSGAVRKWRGWIAVGLLVVLGAGFFWQVDKRRAALSGEIAELGRQARLAKESGLHDVGPERLAQLQTQVARFREGFIRPSEVAALLDELSGQAEKFDVRVLALQSGDPVVVSLSEGSSGAGSGEAYQRLPIRMQAEGTTRAFGDLLEALSRSSKRIFVVESMGLSRGRESAATLECELTLSYFSQAAEAA